MLIQIDTHNPKVRNECLFKTVTCSYMWLNSDRYDPCNHINKCILTDFVIYQRKCQNERYIL